MIEHNIIAISDIALGYGSPQIPAFIQSMAVHYDTKAYVLETDEPHRSPQKPMNSDRLDIKRAVSSLPYWSMGAHCERNEQSLSYCNTHQPKIFILFSPLQLPIIKRLGYKPDLVILYLLEIDAVHYNHALKRYSDLVDHIVCPESERLKYILGTYCKRPYPKSHVLYNVAYKSKNTPTLPSNKRNGRIVYAGTLNQSLTLAHEFLGDDLNLMPIDVYGNFSGDGADELQKGFFALNEDKDISYKGYVSSEALQEKLPQYAFSFTRWNPAAGMNYEYACPNKFFEALAHGLPPISAPHPQALKIIDKYKCGILAQGFGSEHMSEAIEKAMSIYGTSIYDDMVQNALDAYEKTFNWDVQFNKFAGSLPAL